MLTTEFVQGTPNWADLGTSDSAVTTAFYSGLFGWTAVSAGPEAGGYGFFQQDGKTVCAYGPLNEAGAKPAWTVYFATGSADDTAKAVEQNGGAVRVPPGDVMEEGRMAQFSDQSGAQFAVWQPGATNGFDLVNVPGSLTWVELHTGDPAGARGFYREVFGWAAEDNDMGGMTYTVLSTGGDRETSFGGIMPLFPEEGERSYWQPYFEVADCDATVAEVARLGGTVTVPAQTVPTVGRMAVLADPHGVSFSVIASEN